MPSACTQILNNMICLTVRHLCNDSRGKAWFPSPDKMQQFSVMVNSHDTINDVIGFMDGVSFMAKCTREQIQL